MTKMKDGTFMERLMLDEIKPEDVMNYVKYWSVNGIESELKDFLGLTDMEFELFIEDETIIDLLYRTRKLGSIII